MVQDGLKHYVSHQAALGCRQTKVFSAGWKGLGQFILKIPDFLSCEGCTVPVVIVLFRWNFAMEEILLLLPEGSAVFVVLWRWISLKEGVMLMIPHILNLGSSTPTSFDIVIQYSNTILHLDALLNRKKWVPHCMNWTKPAVYVYIFKRQCQKEGKEPPAVGIAPTATTIISHSSVSSCVHCTCYLDSQCSDQLHQMHMLVLGGLSSLDDGVVIHLFSYRRIIIITFPLTMRVVGAPQVISQPVSSIFPCSALPFHPVEDNRRSPVHSQWITITS